MRGSSLGEQTAWALLGGIVRGVKSSISRWKPAAPASAERAEREERTIKKGGATPPPPGQNVSRAASAPRLSPPRCVMMHDWTHRRELVPPRLPPDRVVSPAAGHTPPESWAKPSVLTFPCRPIDPSGPAAHATSPACRSPASNEPRIVACRSAAERSSAVQLPHTLWTDLPRRW